MLPLWDMLLRNGGTDALARQFQLSQMQVQNALDALLPAFSEAFKRFTADPTGMGAFAAALASNQHARYWEDASRAFAPQGTQDGQAILGQLFGSDALARTVAENAARMTGLGSDLLRNMMPALATLLMGGLGAQAQAKPAAGMANPFAAMMEAFSQRMPPGGLAGFANPWAAAAWTQPPRGEASAADPWSRMFSEWMGGAKQAPPQPETPVEPLRAIFDTMFETGRKAQDDYGRNIQALFDQYWKSAAPPKP